MNLRSLTQKTIPYYKINREERNLSAILYHMLLCNNNLNKFLEVIYYDEPIIQDEIAIYFEYAFVRDLWKSIDIEKDIELRNKKKKRIILDLLNPINSNELESSSIEEFNSYFGSSPKPSTTEIQNPAKWCISNFNTELVKNETEYVKICRFKWCFNAKPDIVIHTSLKTAICIETKFESDTGKYKIPLKMGQSKYVNQLEIQKQLMEEILGINTDYIYVLKKHQDKKNENYKSITWVEIFKSLDKKESPKFIRNWIEHLEINQL